MRKIRVDGLDIFRGLALLFMMIYHFTYDLNYFHFIYVDMNHTTIFLVSRYIIMSMFLFSVGVSLALVHKNSINWKSIKKRLIQLGTASSIVTVATYFVFPTSWIYFGILHFILIASLLGVIFIPYPKLSILLALLLLIGSYLNILNMHGLYNLLQPILHLPLYTEDLVPLTPWFAIVLLGVSSVYYMLHEKIFKSYIFQKKNMVTNTLKVMGKNSLLIYLIHQPIFFMGFELFNRLFT